ncbi:MAG: translation initiation factor IF-3 [Bacteroidales bacterium]|nr:translation initiation factor IF-3 [Bacteroidales bacterium]
MAKDNQQNDYRINRAIRAPFVRVTGDNVDKPGVYSIREAIEIAEQLEMDLVEIVPTADPPVCKVIDYQKFLYQQKRKQKELQSKTQKMTIKELRFGPQTDDHDYNFKLNHAKKFLEEGNKVKAYVFFKGRSIVYKEQGEILLLKLANDLEEYGKIDQMPKLEGKKMQIVISPKPKKK